MSNYENQEYSMQLAASGDDPFEYDWTRLRHEIDQPMPGLFDDITLASLQEDIDVDASDWSTLNDALENGSWQDIFHLTAGGQGVEAQPGDRASPIPMPERPHTAKSGNSIASFVCDHQKCGSNFKRKGDLKRHQKKHTGQREFACTAQECKYSFTKNDKLLDHMCAGHDDETLYACPKSRCQALLTRDVLPVHLSYSSAFRPLNSYRQCPLPKCSFRVSIKKLDELQHHLLEKHDAKGRKRFASLLLNRGYDYDSASVVCPICPDKYLFTTHSEFRRHLLDNHCGQDTANLWQVLRARDDVASESAPQGLREHRHTILSLISAFSNHHVWNDIRCKAEN